MNKIKKILCIIDFEDDADDAIRQANLFARNHYSQLIFLAVTPSIDRNAVLFPHFHEKLSMDESNLASEISNSLYERIERLTGRNAEEFQVISESGSEVAVAIRIAEELAADLVVISDTALKHSESWFGDIASRIIRYTHCSVLLTRPEQGGHCVVAATDFSDPAFPAVEAAALEAQLRHFHLVLIHSLGELRVATPIPPEPASMGMITGEEFKAITHRAHEQLVHVLKTIGDIGEPIVSDDLPADAIVRLAKERRADLVVVGTLGRSGIPRLVLGSTAEAVVDSAPCSVLVVRLHG
jgi:nucleotide-binding universal stress UspA family protein